MRSIFAAAVVAAAICSAPAAALAVTIDFNDVDTTSGNVFVDSYSKDGIVFRSNVAASVPFLGSDISMDPDGAAAYAYWLDMRMTEPKGSFDLEGFTVGQPNSATMLPGFISVRFGYASGAENVETFEFAGMGAQALSLTRTGLRFVEFQYLSTPGSTGPFELDDINLDNLVVSYTPEPATWAMMILGFGVAGGAIRRQRQTASVPA